jgi:MEDS: MEthanogen/methylotroph, DcmR Sensory domain
MAMPGHTALLYRDESFLIASVTDFIKRGLYENEAVLVIVTPHHRKRFYTTLTSEHLLNEKLMFWDVEEVLELFMVDDCPDETEFMQVMGTILRPACDTGCVRVFGEMVAVLCTETNTGAALRLEELWNALGMRYDFSLLCAYPMSAMCEDAGTQTRQRIRQLHQLVYAQ